MDESDATILHGSATELALENFGVSGRPFPLAVIHELAGIKAAWAAVNAQFSDTTGVDEEMASAIAAAAHEVAAGRWDEHFRIDVFQTGSGTSSNMNVNEVIATLASRRLGRAVHPNDHVNASQSSNDTVPTAIRLAALSAVEDELLPGLTRLAEALDERADAFHDVVKAGRTHLMDAAPITLGQEFAAYATMTREAVARVESAMARLGLVPLGGTATGNGLNTPAGAAEEVVLELARRSGLPVACARDRFARQGGQDALVEMSAQVRGAAVTLAKIANDVRLLSSGPRTGFGEIHLPSLQPGSSIMPGKVNPVLVEVVTQVTAQVIGNDVTVAHAGSQGTLELNTYLPVMAVNLLDSITLTGRAASDFARRCVAGIEADVERCRGYAEATPAVATSLNLVVGYDEAARIVKKAEADGTTVRAVLESEGRLTAEQIASALDVRTLAAGTPSAPATPLSPSPAEASADM